MEFQTKVLVIEVDQQLVKTIQSVLTLRGYDVCCADNGASGIQKAFEYNPDLILCAVKMTPVDKFSFGALNHQLYKSFTLRYMAYFKFDSCLV